MFKRRFSLESTLLFLILVLAFLLRVWGLDFGFPHFLHPDETKMVEPGITVAFGAKEALLTGDWGFFNPHFFFYPGFLMYLLSFSILVFKIIIQLLNFLPWVDVDFTALPKTTFYLLARFLSVSFGVGTVFLVYRMGKKLKNSWVGLTAAFLLAVNFLHVLNSHYYTGDIAATFFTTLALFWILCSKDGLPKEDRLWLWGAAVATGIGIATKYYPFLVLVPLVIAIFLQQTSLWVKVKSAILSFLIAGVTFILLAPFTLLAFSQFWQEFLISRLRSATGVFGFLSPDFWYYLTSRDISSIEPVAQNSLWQGMGTPFLLIFLFALGFCWRKKDARLRLLALFCLVHYVFFALNIAKFIRWLLPLLPLAAVFVALILDELRRLGPLFRRLVLPLLLSSILIPNLWRVGLADFALSQKDTRTQAYEWTEKNIPDGSRVVFEYFSIAQFTRRSIYFEEFDHPRYNVAGEIASSRPPDYQWLKTVFQPQFIIVNGYLRDRYYQSGMQELFPETCRAWLEIYDKIEQDYQVAVRFRPTFPGNWRAGPEMIIYVPK